MAGKDVNERMALELPEAADTIGGFVFGLLGHTAQQGERTHWERVDFVMKATDGRRITKVRLVQCRDGEAPDRNDEDHTRTNGVDTDQAEMLTSE